MALFNKLFNTKGRNVHDKAQNNLREKLFAFNKEQVRLLLFRECDFRGRKLLFDSSCVKKIPTGTSVSSKTEWNEPEKFVEVSDGFGYVYTRAPADFNKMAEMVFGSVAMSYRGTYFKIHSLEAPNRIMFTQVFPSPYGRSQSSRSYTPTSIQSLEHSTGSKFGQDSGANSANSTKEQLTTASDTVLVCRKMSFSSSLVVEAPLSVSHPSTVADSGYDPETSSNGTSAISSIGSMDKGSTISLSSSGLYKRLLRRASTSLENSSGISFHHSCGGGGGGSTEDYHPKHHSRNSKLGLSLIVELSPGQEEEQSQFFMDHVVLLETMLWRARQVVEMAYLKLHNFVSLMVEMANLTTQYLVSLLSESYISMNLWLLFSSSCDNYNSISAFSAALSDSITNSVSSKIFAADSDPNRNVTGGVIAKQIESSLFNISRLWRPEWDSFNISAEMTAETFVRDFCELLETIDVKDTNFFMSTLLTAVLTHHLGWVNTCLSTIAGENVLMQTKNPFNPLWGELSDLYGALGHPTKMAQTIITGADRRDIVSKILTSLTYFIRCCDVDRKIPVRVNVQEENCVVDQLCQRYSCIPKENYKKYEDHLKEMMISGNDFVKNSPLKHQKTKLVSNGERKTLTKTRTCLDNLSAFSAENSNSPDQNIFLCSDIKSKEFNMYLRGDEVSRKIKSMTQLPSSTVICRRAFLPPDSDYANNNTLTNGHDNKSNVVFVLGDNDKLVDLKKNDATNLKRPSFLNLLKHSVSSGDFRDSDFIENANNDLIKPSTSWTTPNPLNEPDRCKNERDSGGGYSRSQSVPPEDRTMNGQIDGKVTSKYRYSGVKFNLQQYPQILSNYMKSKNLEMSNLQLGDKGLKLDELSSMSDVITSKYPEIDDNFEDGEALQTPSNASEMEFASDMQDVPPGTTTLNVKQDTVIDDESCRQRDLNKTDHGKPSRQVEGRNKMKVANLPMPKSVYAKPIVEPIRYTSSLMRTPNDIYMPDMVLQAPTRPREEWESRLKNDLALASQHSPIDQPVEEAVAVIANTDTWEVQLMSSHTFVIDKNSTGVRVGMSQLVSNMLETLVQMWKLRVPPHYCLMHIEQTLQQLCVRSQALAELLLATEFCTMEHLTSTLHLEVSDVPLLLAVASTHTPQVTEKYGLHFQ